MSAATGAGSDGRWRRDAEMPFQKLEEETIVLDPRRREVHLLNESASLIWELLASARSVDELTAALSDEYDAAEGDVREAVVECLDALTTRGLLIADGAR
jgi:hypothetical protein